MEHVQRYPLALYINESSFVLVCDEQEEQAKRAEGYNDLSAFWRVVDGKEEVIVSEHKEEKKKPGRPRKE